MLGVAKSKVTVRDKGFKAVTESLMESARLRAMAGVFSDTDPEIETYAAVNEYGNAHQKPRPFMRLAAAAMAGELGEKMEIAVSGMIDSKGRRNRAELQELANFARDKIKAQIASGTTPPPDKEVTINKKGHDQTLIETRRLLEAVRARVVKKGSPK